MRHSRSPVMMKAAFRELGLDWHYLRVPVPPELFDETVRALPVSGYAGANVTLPHKLAAHALADVLSPAAKAIGAVNTLSFHGDSVEGDNTDAGGFLDALGEPPSRNALVLGAGGAARAVVWALRDAGVEVAVWNRTAERAVALAAELGARQVDKPEGAGLIVNATSVGLGGNDSEESVLGALGLEEIEPPDVLVDLVYGEEPTALCRWAERAGARVVDGLEVLVRQGARSLECWSGQAAPIEAMRTALAPH